MARRMADSVELTIQDPGLQSGKLIDAIVEAAEGAERGGGIFAFATKGGIDLLLGDKVIEPLVKDREFRLVVGVDSITDERALKSLNDWSQRSEGLIAQVFVHELPQIFHPKLCWFGVGETVTVVLGSGNLTQWGLSANFEAFLVASLEGETGAVAEAEIVNWLADREQQLFAPDAPQALERARKNSGSERALRRKMAPDKESLDQSPIPAGTAEVLLFQLGKKKAGRTLLDLGKKQFENYFHGEAAEKRHITIQYVEGDGSLVAPEPLRPVYRVPSGNYRLESDQKREVASPDREHGVPIGVFVHMPNGVFRYRLLWPGDEGYAEVDACLEQHHDELPRVDALKRAMISLSVLAEAWPDSPFLRMPGSPA